MAYDYNAILRAATWGLNEEQTARVHLGLNAAALYGILERLRGNGSYIGPATRLEPIFDQKLADLKKLCGPQPASASQGAEAEGGPDDAEADFLRELE
jgi:hypothetical protein